ncbi:SEC-C motif-containing protein [Lentibacillus persicus]|uniref:SEC-C motif-containing protein n=1 Tax=Lentibacillus persicus TaxID=640948 RepID=A0A1I1VWT2_9BACI|nr:SEC-C domain-containing protein [Lentibacillus persicus]SFD86548.1 SEC-C motif-containing protein [Lentibacillus persicus]
MSKIKRNELCPCGSGKKYKHCHGAANPPNSSIQMINNELYQLHRKFISLVMSTYATNLDNIKTRYDKSSINEDADTADIYHTGLTLWILFHVAMLPHGDTVFGDFFKKHHKKMSKQARDLFARWGESLPSVYKVKKVDENSSQLTIQDFYEDTYVIPYQEGEAFIEGSLVVGTLVPYADQYGFFYTIIKLYRHDTQKVEKLLEKYKEKDGGLRDNFPDFFADALILGKEDSKWDDPLHEDVAQLFADHVIDKNVSDDVLFKAVTIWQDYCKKASPSFRNTAPYAAALEYLVHKDLLNNKNVTQGQLANEYNCSAGSISTNYRKLTR